MGVSFEMLIDLKSLVLLNSALSLVSAIMLTINWRMNQTVKGTKQWALTLWCWAISLIMLLFREHWPDIVILANWFVVVGSLFLLSGISEYHYTKGIPKWISIAISLLMFYGFYYCFFK